MEERRHQVRLAAFERGAGDGVLPGVLRGGNSDQPLVDARAHAGREGLGCRP